MVAHILMINPRVPQIQPTRRRRMLTSKCRAWRHAMQTTGDGAANNARPDGRFDRTTWSRFGSRS